MKTLDTVLAVMLFVAWFFPNVMGDRVGRIIAAAMAVIP